MLSGNVRKRFRRGRKMLRSGNRRLRRSTLLPLKKQVARLSAIANVERHWYDRAATGIQIVTGKHFTATTKSFTHITGQHII